MKKTLFLSSVLIFSILITGCGKKDNTEITIEETIPSNDDICIKNGGSLTNRAEGGDIIVCAFDDESFCFLEDLESGLCKKGYIFFNEDIDNTKDKEDSIDTENCEQKEQEIVCGEDGNTYFNRCYLNAAGVEEETELAHVENEECVFE